MMHLHGEDRIITVSFSTIDRRHQQVIAQKFKTKGNTSQSV